MGLKELKSNLDVVGGFGGAPNQTSTNQSTIPGASVNNALPDPHYNTLNGTSDSPFSSKSGDHMVDLLTQQAISTNTNNTYQPSPQQSSYQDLDGNQGPQSQLPTTDASQKHIDSLQSVNQDLDGLPGPQSQLPTTDASQAHIDSLQQVPGPPQSSPYQDLDGVQGPQFQKITTDASQAHIDSLQQVPGGSENSPYQDLDGVQGPQFQRETTIASQVHESSLGLVPGFSENSPFQDLDGFSNNPSFGDAGGAGKQLSNKDLHESLLTEHYQYSHNTPVVTINAGVKDLNGELPLNGEYINNFPS
tara:strand:+ start:3749 stop:4660 length:912 start_codon:yes stop_codon:yes gene_type:complete